MVSGANFITLPDADVFKAKPGDVINYIVDQSHSSNSSLSLSTSPNATSAPVLQSQTNTTSSYNIFQNFSLYGFVPYEAKISIRIMNPGVLPLGMTIREMASVVNDFRNIITIQRPVSGLKFNYKSVIRINTSRSIGFELSRGTNSSCDWLLTGTEVNIKGSVNYTTESTNYKVQRNDTNADAFEGLGTSFQYPHDVPDDLTFLVNCSNKVSTLSENVTISVRRNIWDFNASLRFASFAYTPAQTYWTSRAYGDHVGYKWLIENEVYRTAKVQMEFQSGSLPGNKMPVNVTAWNVVSKQKKVISLDVLKNPLSIQFLPDLIVASGENISIGPILNWSPYPNGTALYTDYGINISNYLQKFIEFPTFRVKIDDSLISGNISNGTLLTYKFAMAGSESAWHEVYIEAVGHPEMNREIEVQVLDRVAGLEIDSRCSNQVIIGETCTFTAKFGGSDVVCDWTVDSQTFQDTCQSRNHMFKELGNFTVIVNASNRISSQKAVYNVSVVPELPRSSTGRGYEITTTYIKHASSIASSVTMATRTSFAKESQAQDLSSNVKPSTTLSLKLTNTLADTTVHHLSSSTIRLSSIVHPESLTVNSNKEQASLIINSSASELSLTAITSSITSTTYALSSGTFLNQNETISVLSSKINISPSERGPSNRIIGNTSSSVAISSQTPSTILPTSAFMLDQSDSLSPLPSKIIASFTQAGPSSRSIDQASSSVAISSLTPSTILPTSAFILDKNDSVSPISRKITASSSQAGPSSRIINPSRKILKITGPQFAAVGQMVTFYVLNVASSIQLTWLINDTKRTTTNNSVSYIFNHPGEFKVFVNSSTTNQNANFTVTVQDPISGFQAFVYQKALGKRVDVLLAIDSGTDVSYSINFGDNSETSVGKVRELAKNISVYHLYAKPGYYNLSILVFSKVGPNSTEYAKVFVNDTCKLESAILFGASENIKNPSHFSDKEEIVMALKTMLDCTKVPQLKYSWKVVRLDSGIPDGLPMKLASTHEALFQFPASRISIGDYKVQATVENCMDGSSLTRIGYFSKVPGTLGVRIACGTTRMVSVDEPLTMNVSVIAGSDYLTYEWFCDHMFNVTCFSNEIGRNTSVVRFPGNYFNVGEVHEFVVQVNDGTRQGVTSQKVIFGVADMTLDLCLRYVGPEWNSILNCG